MIDMHAHWRPAELADALRARVEAGITSDAITVPHAGIVQRQRHFGSG